MGLMGLTLSPKMPRADVSFDGGYWAVRHLSILVGVINWDFIWKNRAVSP